jgi:hypothetical protein
MNWDRAMPATRSTMAWPGSRSSSAPARLAAVMAGCLEARVKPANCMMTKLAV